MDNNAPIKQQVSSFIVDISRDSKEVGLGKLINFILPPKADSSPYNSNEIDDRLNAIEDELILTQKTANDQFDDVLNDDSLKRVQELHQNLRKTHVDIVKLECDIAYAKEQFHLVESLRDNTHIKELSKPERTERDLTNPMQRPKFQPLTDFFDDTFDRPT